MEKKSYRFKSGVLAGTGLGLLMVAAVLFCVQDSLVADLKTYFDKSVIEPAFLSKSFPYTSSIVGNVMMFALVTGCCCIAAGLACKHLLK